MDECLLLNHAGTAKIIWMKFDIEIDYSLL